MDTERIQQLTEELRTIEEWDRLAGEDKADPVGKVARLQRTWEIIVELGEASVKTDPN